MKPPHVIHRKTIESYWYDSNGMHPRMIMVPERTMCWVENNGEEKNRRGRVREGGEGGENIRNKSSNTHHTTHRNCWCGGTTFNTYEIPSRNSKSNFLCTFVTLPHMFSIKGNVFINDIWVDFSR